MCRKLLACLACLLFWSTASAQFQVQIDQSKAGPFASNYKTREAAISSFESKCMTWPDAVGRIVETSSGASVRLDCTAEMERRRNAQAERLSKEKAQREAQQQFPVFAQSSAGAWQRMGGYPTEQAARAAAQRQCIDRGTSPRNLAAKYVDAAGKEVLIACQAKP